MVLMLLSPTTQIHIHKPQSIVLSQQHFHLHCHSFVLMSIYMYRLCMCFICMCICFSSVLRNIGLRRRVQHCLLRKALPLSRTLHHILRSTAAGLRHYKFCKRNNGPNLRTHFCYNKGAFLKIFPLGSGKFTKVKMLCIQPSHNLHSYSSTSET